MNLKPEELVKALRCCAEGECSGCPMYADKQRCQEQTLAYSADQIERDQKEIAELREENERLTAENADLGKEIEWKDMVIALAQREQAKAEAERDALIEQIKERLDCRDCKHNDFCDFDSYTVLGCMNCVSEVCPCAGCFDSSRWEWRGLPEAPEEGEKEDA